MEKFLWPSSSVSTIKLAPPPRPTPSHSPEHPHVFWTHPRMVDHTTSLERLFQNLTTLFLTKFFHLSNLNLLGCNLRPFPLIFFFQHWVNLSWPTGFWHSCVNSTNTASPTLHPSFLDVRLGQVNFNTWCSQRML